MKLHPLWTFALLLAFIIGSHSSSSDTDDSDKTVWTYMMDKYPSSTPSSSGSSGVDVGKIVKSLRKCGGGQDSSSSLITGGTTCNGVPLEEIHNLTTLRDISHQILYFVDNPECCDQSHLKIVQVNQEEEDEGNKKTKPSSAEVWGYGILCVTLISLCSLAGVSVMPFMKKEFYKHLLTALIGLAVGSLTGSAIFHLIPQAFKLADHDPDHGYLNTSFMLWGGIWMFFMVERFLKFIMDYKDKKDHHLHHHLQKDHVPTTVLVENNGNCVKTAEELPVALNGSLPSSKPLDLQLEAEEVYECQEQVIKASFGHQKRPIRTSVHDHSIKFEQGKDSVIATVAYMIIFGDGLHNFIDGLSIGAAFNESILTGISISMAVFCEELPHELGDFAVLLNSGMTIRQALTYNFLSACTCYIGMAVGIFLGEIEASTYIFGLAGGMFLYISLSDMIPEMNEVAEEASKTSMKRGALILLLQNIGMFIGIMALFLLAKYQDHIQF